jgi:hypothetical protein
VILFITSVVISLLVGGCAAFFAKRYDLRSIDDRPRRITGVEFAIAVPVVAVVAALVTIWVGPGVAQSAAASGYKQFFNGSVTQALSQEIECTRDGSCVHTYSCDPYTVQVPYTVEEYAGTDSKGNPKYRTVTKYRTEVRYHDCPYATAEYSYWLTDSLGGETTIASHIFAAKPQQWRGDEGIPGGVPRGVPERWLTSKNRLAAGDAEPVTRIKEYKNYILASQEDLLKQFSGDIDSYKNAGLLPAHTAGVPDGDIMYDYDLQARKVQFVGMNPVNEQAWQSALMQLNAALGTERQGDMHIVVVPASKVSNPDAYINALVAYWQSDEYFGKWGLPKNALAVVLGVSDDASTISWARAKTGMPFGNGELLSAVSFDLKDKPFDPKVVLGSVTAQPTQASDGKFKVKYAYGSGIISNIVLQEHPFQRACMDCAGDKVGSYVYLESTIPISPLANFVMLLLVIIINSVLWGALIVLEIPSKVRNLRPSKRMRNYTSYPWRG